MSTSCSKIWPFNVAGLYCQSFTASNAAWRKIGGPLRNLRSVKLPFFPTLACTTTVPEVLICIANAGYCGGTLRSTRAGTTSLCRMGVCFGGNTRSGGVCGGVMLLAPTNASCWRGCVEIEVAVATSAAPARGVGSFVVERVAVFVDATSRGLAGRVAPVLGRKLTATSEFGFCSDAMRRCAGVSVCGAGSADCGTTSAVGVADWTLVVASTADGAVLFKCAHVALLTIIRRATVVIMIKRVAVDSFLRT